MDGLSKSCMLSWWLLEAYESTMSYFMQCCKLYNISGFVNLDWVRRQAVWHIQAVNYCLCKCSHIHENFRTMLTNIGSSAEMELEVEEEPNEKIHSPILNSHYFCDDEDNDGDHSQIDTVPFDVDYNDSASAPIKNTRAPWWKPGVWTVNHYGVILDECWSCWKDVGYQLHPTFFSTIHFEVPIHDTLLHCPTPWSTPYSHSETWQEPTVLHLSTGAAQWSWSQLWLHWKSEGPCEGHRMGTLTYRQFNKNYWLGSRKECYFTARRGHWYIYRPGQHYLGYPCSPFPNEFPPTSPDSIQPWWCHILNK